MIYFFSSRKEAIFSKDFGMEVSMKQKVFSEMTQLLTKMLC